MEDVPLENRPVVDDNTVCKASAYPHGVYSNHSPRDPPPSSVCNPTPNLILTLPLTLVCNPTPNLILTRTRALASTLTLTMIAHTV